jgi:putative protein kinase ArgK-like GTPase of G3E family
MSDHPMMAPPRQLDDVEQAERAEHCYELHTRIVSALGEGRSAMWRACEALHEFDEEAGWTEHKKRMGAERRATLQALIEACRDEGWLDAE